MSLSAPLGGAEISGPGLKFIHMKMSGSEQLMILIHDGALMLNTLFLFFFCVTKLSTSDFTTVAKVVFFFNQVKQTGKM